jgi:hypothetical protein
LTTLSRAGAKGESSTATKKVMVRVGGGMCVVHSRRLARIDFGTGWQDLQLYILNRAAGF